MYNNDQRLGMTYSDVNNVSLPESGDEFYPVEHANAIMELDKTKVQHKIAEMIQNGSDFSIKLGDETLNFEQLYNYSNDGPYAFKIKYLNELYRKEVVKKQEALPEEEMPADYKLVYKQTVKNEDGNVNIKTITVNSNDGVNISTIIYNIGIPENSANKVEELTESSTNQQYPSAKTVYEFTNDQINKTANYYITKNAAGDPFSTKSELLSATKYYCGGVLRTPERNDYCVVLADESHDNGSARYIYQNGNWQFQRVYSTKYTEAQEAAIDSGVNSIKVAQYDSKLATMDMSKMMLFKEQSGYNLKGIGFPFTISAIAYGNGKFVVVGVNGRIAYSDDGIIWTETASPLSSSYKLYDITFGGDKFIAVADNAIIYSYDGIVWNRSTFTTTPSYGYMFSAVCYGNNLYVAVGSAFDSGYHNLGVSSDGITWTTYYRNTLYPAIGELIYYKGYYITTRQIDEPYYSDLYYSTNGTTWSKAAWGHSTRGAIYGLSIANDKLFISNDDATRYTTTVPPSISSATTINQKVREVAYNDGLYVGVWSMFDWDLWKQLNQIKYSNDLVNWTINSTGIGQNNSEYLKDKFITHAESATGYTLEKLKNKLEQQSTDITNDVKQFLSNRRYKTSIFGVSGTNYGEQATTFTGIKYIWYGSQSELPDQATQALYKNTMFCTPEDGDMVGNLIRR